MVGYEKIVRDVIGKGKTYKALNSKVATVHVFYHILGAKSENADFEFYKKLLFYV